MPLTTKSEDPLQGGTPIDDERSSYRQILRSSTIVGGATFLSLAINVIRLKMFALALGPAGMGLVGLYTSFLNLGAAVAGLGLSTSAVQRLASIRGARRERLTRVSIVAITASLALAALLLMIVFGDLIAGLSGVPATTASIVLLAIGVSLSVVTATQIAFLQGYRRIADMARLRIYSSVLATIVGVVLIVAFGPPAIVPAIVAIPAASVLVGLFIRAPAPRGTPAQLKPRLILREWRALAALGAVVMVSGMFAAGTQLAVRAMLAKSIGLEAAGYYQAVWTASVTNVSLILAAMAADYLPRLSAAANDRTATARLVNQQLRVALLLGAPILLSLAAVAPLAMRLLYSAEFVVGGPLLRWHVAGDSLKLLGWALGFSLMARRASGLFLAMEAIQAIAYTALAFYLTPRFGLHGVGVAYLASYVCYTVAITLAVRRSAGLVVARANLGLQGLLTGALLVTLLAGFASDLAAFGCGALFALGFALYAARHLGQIVNGSEVLARIAQRFKRAPR